jgi:hypothetical protein
VQSPAVEAVIDEKPHIYLHEGHWRVLYIWWPSQRDWSDCELVHEDASDSLRLAFLGAERGLERIEGRA